MDLSKFNSENLFEAATDLFEQLGITLNSNTTTAMTIDGVLKEHRGKAPVFDAVGDVYFLGIVEDSVFNRSPSESGYTLEAGIDEADRSYDGLMIFAVDLNKRPTRTDLSALTRAFNRISKAMPVAVLANYDVDSEAVFSLAISERFKYSQTWREGEKVGKIILLKDIKTTKTHAGHERILEDLKRTTDVTTYAQLHAKWLKILDTKELNKTFFQELANWYFWAVETVEFPTDEEDDDEVRNATSVIRLITRLMFVWFLKEKGLVSEKLFDEKHLKAILNFKEDSSYYKAVLQNLFFATLNSDMGKRKFIAEPSGGRNNQHFVHNVFRYKREFKKPDETVRELFEPIPFLNGGLFECLDKEIEAEGGKTIRVRVDSFSDHPKNVLFVPDELFFGAEDEIDLNEIYGTKNKRYKVRGLINILNRYKFTIAENTPLEEEIALDPELLGKVFENLLASYNPETKTTARKQTGSFYTPREIVNYMVDESLIAYLKQKLQTESEGFGYVAFGDNQTTMFGNEARVQQKLELPVMANRLHGKEEELESALRDLFSYSDEVHPFNETETEILIKGIDNCKILDPACGSGAFPMGILHRLVHLLGKLDKDNSKWKQWQKQKAIKETEKAFEIGDVKERENRLIEINKIFEENSDDYGRKLFLIENCIYGVDIQPIAIQIAKLRFFISLIVDQKAGGDASNNLGIRPLPNLETKFVAANTLIGLEAQGGLKPPEVFDLEKRLKVVRAKHFGARTRGTKDKYRNKDKEIRLEIADLLKQGGIKADVADQIAEWNPYDQNASAAWFDAEYMFGIEKGFDIVIANPPYFLVQDKDEKAYYRGEFKTLHFKINLFACFIEKGYYLLKPNGFLTFINPNLLFANDSFKLLREFLCKSTSISFLLNLGDGVFENVTMPTMLFLLEKRANIQNKFKIFPSITNEDLTGDYFLNTQKSVLENYNFVFETTNPLFRSLLDKIYNGTVELESVLDINQGIITGNDSHFVSTAKQSARWKHTLRGRDIEAYKITYPKLYVNYSPSDLACPRNETLFDVSEKLVMRRTGDYPVAAYDDQQTYNLHTLYSCRATTDLPLKFILSLLNSTLFKFLYKQKLGTEAGRIFAEIKILYVRKLPVKKGSRDIQEKLSKLVDAISVSKLQERRTETDELQKKIDELVYQLYGLADDEIAIVEERAN